ncbi:hypothetical protein BH11BAC4_BH11BAC4_12450 [soil metagenome]
MRLLVSLLIAIVTIQTASAQRNCGTEDYIRNFYKPETMRPGAVNGHARDTVPNEIISIPVVVHLLFNTNEQNISDEQIKSQLDVLNRDFRRMNTDATNTPAAFRPMAADSRIMFCLAQVAPDGRPTKGIIRKFTGKDFFLGDDAMKYSAAGGDDIWDPTKYLNIWVCSLFGRSLGYATPPGGPADKDGVVINFDVFGKTGIVRYPYDKGRTTTHEVGHWLGLKHIWGDDNCGTDDVEDTPRQLGYNYGCPSFPHVTSCSQTINGDMFMNFMDFTDDACMNMFSNGQKQKMRGLFALGNTRNSFLNSFACDSTLASGAPLPDDTIPTAKPDAGISIFPNPVQVELTFVAVNGYELSGKVLAIYSTQGKLIRQQILTSNKEKINLGSLAAGIYIAKVGIGADKRIMKIIKL